jgi:hypothetical protein
LSDAAHDTQVNKPGAIETRATRQRQKRRHQLTRALTKSRLADA